MRDERRTAPRPASLTAAEGAMLSVGSEDILSFDSAEWRKHL
jgi:hypothetical protein